MNPIRARKINEKEARRSTIIASAKVLFHKTGFENTSIDDIAHDCQLSRSLLYTYFYDKSHLLVAIVCEALSTMISDFQARQNLKLNGLDKIYEIGWAYVRFAQNSPEYYSAILSFQSSNFTPLSLDGKKDTMIEAYNQDFFKLVERSSGIIQIMVQIITQGFEDNTIKNNATPEELAKSLWAMTGGLIQAHSADENLIKVGLDLMQKGLRT